MTSDGGFLCIENNKGDRFPILIPEVKNQGTNDLRQQEGLKKQAKGNAIERLGKNVLRDSFVQTTNTAINEIFSFIPFFIRPNIHTLKTIVCF